MVMQMQCLINFVERYQCAVILDASFDLLHFHMVSAYDTIRYGIFTCTQKLTRWPA